jgi:hypothetical protein
MLDIFKNDINIISRPPVLDLEEHEGAPNDQHANRLRHVQTLQFLAEFSQICFYFPGAHLITPHLPAC